MAKAIPLHMFVPRNKWGGFYGFSARFLVFWLFPLCCFSFLCFCFSKCFINVFFLFQGFICGFIVKGLSNCFLRCSFCSKVFILILYIIVFCFFPVDFY